MKQTEDTATIDLVDQYTVTAIDACKARVIRIAKAIGVTTRRK